MSNVQVGELQLFDVVKDDGHRAFRQCSMYGVIVVGSYNEVCNSLHISYVYKPRLTMRRLQFDILMS